MKSGARGEWAHGEQPARGPRSASEWRVLMLGVFFTFAPIGPLLMMLVKPPGNWVAGLVAGSIAGLIAIGWATCFIRRAYWWLAAVVLVQFLAPPQIFRYLRPLGVFRWQAQWNDTTRLSVLGLMAVGSLVAGYVATIRFVRGVERRGARDKAELDLAAGLHAHLVPDLAGTWSGAEYVARSNPSAAMGGDLVEIIAAEDRCDICVADVSGHGVKAGVVMAMVKAALRLRHPARPELHELLGELNGVLECCIQPGMFVTAACLRLRPANAGSRSADALPESGSEPAVEAGHGAAGARVVEYALAGHPPVLHYHAAGGAVTALPNERLPLGISADEKMASARTIAHPGDIFMLYTDGLHETLNRAGRQLGLEALAALLGRHAGTPDLSACHEAISRAVREFGPQNDDRTLVLVRIGVPVA